MSVTPEQKIKLMLELGLENAASKFAEANNLTAMKFRTISKEKIDELLSVEYQQSKPFDMEATMACVIVSFFIDMFYNLGSVHPSLLFSIAVPLVALALGCFVGWPKVVTEIADVCDMPLADWEDNLPYGALLSVKEAKAQGFKDFTIYFPAKQGSYYSNMQRLKNDPIITATKKGSNKLYNIFAWDDSKIYE